MISNGLDTTNFWLATIAIVTVLQLLLFGAAAWLAYRLYSQAMTVLCELEARHVAPVTARVHCILDEVQEITSRVRDAEGVVRHKVKLVAETGRYAVAAMRARTWAIVGLARGVRAGLAVLSGRA